MADIHARMKELDQQFDDEKLYKVLDRDGCEMPLHYNGRHRTHDEATNLCAQLNQNGEFKPYRIEPAN